MKRPMMPIYLAKPLSSRWEWGTRLSKIDPDLARVATFSDRENAAISRDLYRLAQVLVDQFVGRYSKVAEVIVLDLGHAEVDERFFFYYFSHLGWTKVDDSCCASDPASIQDRVYDFNFGHRDSTNVL